MISLACKCGATEEHPTNRAAYDAGWRLHKNAQMCPSCFAKHDARSRRKLVAIHGEARVKFAEDCVRRLHS